MKRIGDVTQQVYSNSYGKKNSSSSIAIERLGNREEDEILDFYTQLIDPKYRGWCVIRLRELGKTKFIGLADRAIKYGKNPQKMFVSLIK